MENKNTKGIMDFLSNQDSENHFGELDYLLKDGVHIQNHPSQVRFYSYIKTYEEDLSAYYEKLFRVKLVFGGADSRKYYFLDFNDGNRGNISEKHRHILKNEHVIIGFLIYKIIYIDRDVDLNSVQKLKEKIRIDFEEYKSGIYRLIAKSKNTNPGNINDENIDTTIQSALQEFRKIGWLTLEKDEFDLLPAFDRLITVYEEYIQNIEQTIEMLR